MDGRERTERQIILVVDDDESVRATLRLVLEMEGYGVVEAAEGKEALARIHGAQDSLPSAILTDWNMPNGMGGEALLGSVKRDPALANIPVVIVSGTADRSALKAGAAQVVHKPFALDSLLSIVKSVCSEIGDLRSQMLAPVSVGGGG